MDFLLSSRPQKHFDLIFLAQLTLALITTQLRKVAGKFQAQAVFVLFVVNWIEFKVAVRDLSVYCVMKDLWCIMSATSKGKLFDEIFLKLHRLS